MKKSKLVFLSFLTLMSLSASAVSTFAWFVYNGTDIQFGNGSDTYLKGGAEKSLYASGSGTSGDPYIINTPGQLYNLAWAYYLGKYENPNQYNYFKLGTNLNMSNYTLPPIGTEEHPFVASFDGDGKTIENLTVSNVYTDYGTAIPAEVTSTYFNNHQPKVIGLFGAIGPIYTSSSYEDYSSTTASLTNLTLNNIKTKSATSQTLIGLAAGYVDGNMSGVKVSGTNSSINVASSGVTYFSDTLTKNLSDYSLVGYTKNPVDERGYNQNISAFYDADNNTTGMDADWGGSIDMLSLWERIYNFKYYGGSLQQYDINITKTYGGETLLSSVTNYSTQSYRYLYNEDSNHTRMGNYNIIDQSDSPQLKMYLGGGHSEKNTTYTSYNNYGTGHYICDSNNNYLTYLGSITNQTSESAASVWVFSTGTSAIYTYYNNTQVFLRNNNGTLTTTNVSSSATQWTISINSNNELLIENGNYRLVYFSGWKLINPNNSDSFYVISYNDADITYYISSSNLASKSSPSFTTDLNEAAHFSTNSNYLYTEDSGTRLYIDLYVKSGSYSIRMYTSYSSSGGGGGSYYGFRVNGTSIRATVSSSYYYLTFNNNSWTYSNSSSVSASYVQKTIDYSSFVLNNTTDIDADILNGSGTYSTSGDHLVFDESDTTYIPLNVNQDGGATTSDNFSSYVSSNNYDPTYKNTGYIVAGSLLSAGATSLDSSKNSSMRVSKYSLTDSVENSYSSDDSSLSDSKIYTIYGNSGSYSVGTMADRISAGVTYHRYGSSKGKLYQMLSSDSSYVSGLHFVDSGGNGIISSSNLCRVKNAYINGTSYPNGYDLPLYSIDFNLKKDGYVNFFAGSYAGTTVDSFFTLNQVFRDTNDNTKISNIKEITAIYQDSETNHCIYRYGTSSYTYSEGSSIPSGNYSLVFDTAWIKKTSNELGSSVKNRIFYFEFPLNAGEFCLGNESGGNGGYLLYLDIGANGTQELHGITAYSITTNRTGKIYPAGVDFLVVGVNGYDDGGYSFGLSIASGSTGMVSFNVTENVVTLADSLSTSYSFQGTKWKSTQPSDTDYFYIFGSSPGGLPIKPGGEKISLVTITEKGTDGTSIVYNVKIVDTLDENDSITASEYYFKNASDADYGDPISLETLQTTAASSILQDNVLDLIRSLRTVVTISSDLTDGYHEFASVPTYSPTTGSNAYKTMNVVVSGTSGKEVIVSFLLDGYTVSINGSAASLNSSFTLP